MCWRSIREKVIDLYNERRYLLESGHLDEIEARRFREILGGSTDPALYRRALLDLSAYLHRYHGEKVVILIDEYDEPILSGHFHGYAARIGDFIQAFFSNGLKSNPHLFRAVLTSVLPLANESIFSDANNLITYTLLTKPFNTCFGFTELEVAALLERNGRSDKLEAARDWYDGYLFGNTAIYNPSSVLCFLQQEDERPKHDWLSSPNDLVRELVQRYTPRLQPDFEVLLTGGSVERMFDESVTLSEIQDGDSALWSLLVFSGYLKVEESTDDALGRAIYRFSIPNREVRSTYATTFRA